MGWRGLPIPKDTEAWRQRVAWLRRAEGPASELPDMDEQVLMASAAKWLGPHLAVGGRPQVGPEFLRPAAATLVQCVAVYDKGGGCALQLAGAPWQWSLYACTPA